MLEHEAVSATSTIAILIREGAATLLRVTNAPLARHYRQLMGMAFCDVSDSPSVVPETMNKSCGLLDGRTLASLIGSLSESGLDRSRVGSSARHPLRPGVLRHDPELPLSGRHIDCERRLRGPTLTRLSGSP